MRFFLCILFSLLLLSCGSEEIIQGDSFPDTEESPNGNDSGKDSDIYQQLDSLAGYGEQYGFLTVVPKQEYDIILSNPTENSVVFSIICYRNGVGYLSYDGRETEKFIFEAGKPHLIDLRGLLPEKVYAYRFHFRKNGEDNFSASEAFQFSTAKAKGSSFSFAIIADSHLDMNSDTLTYLKTLQHIASEKNDFIIDLGDTFMVDKYGKEYQQSLGQFFSQRYYLGKICHSLPLYFVQGNHDGETGEKKAAMTAWSKRIRELFFPNPSSENYFSWVWGDALMIVLDPYTFTPQQGAKDPWLRTLGFDQYRWLENTLKRSSQSYKFVFIHNLVGGVDADGQGRGGSEAAPFWEWGGYSLEGDYQFNDKRPLWGEPVHDLLKRYGVNVVFHGHDHLYARQEHDGIIYQCVQQPSLKRYDKLSYGDTYGYKNGVIKYNPGHLKVTVSSGKSRVDYMATYEGQLDSYEL